MALALGVAIGDVIDIADNWIALLGVHKRKVATLITHVGDKVLVSSTYQTEVLPQVWVQLSPERTKLRLVIAAPREMRITRRGSPSPGRTPGVDSRPI